MTLNLKDLARVGAQARLNEVVAEKDALLKMFPELKEGARRGWKAATTSSPAAEKPARKRPAMSAAQKKAVGERMRKYWAAKRAEKAGGAAVAGAPTETTSGVPSRRSGRKGGRKQGRKK